jgi:hypothetical protein
MKKSYFIYDHFIQKKHWVILDQNEGCLLYWENDKEVLREENCKTYTALCKMLKDESRMRRNAKARERYKKKKLLTA